MTGFLARISARKAVAVVAIWGALAIAGGILADDAGLGLNFGFTDALDNATTTEMKLGGGAESSRAESLLEDLRGPKPITEIVIVESDTLTVDDPEFQDKLGALQDELVALGLVCKVEHYFGLGFNEDNCPAEPLPPLTPELLSQREQTVSADRRTTIMRLTLAGDFDHTLENVEDVLEVVHAAGAGDDFDTLVVGDASIALEQNELAESDLRQGERVGIPVALIILVVLFGTVVAALMPIGLSLVCVIVALGITALIGQAFELTFFITLMIIMVGLAVGIDYSLLIVSRFRDELARGLDIPAAIERAGETAGRTVLFSGLTVIIALFGMFLVPFSFFQSLATGAILVVFVALAATLTFLPANLALHGKRINRLAVPFLGKNRDAPSDGAGDSSASEHGFWHRTTRLVMRFPHISIVAVGAPMVVAIVFYFQINTGLNGLDVFPEGAESRDAFYVMEQEFSFGLVNPTEIVIEGDIDSPAVESGIGKLQAFLNENPAVTLAMPHPEVNDAGDLALITVYIQGEPRSHETVDVVNLIREEYIPSAFDGVEAAVLVGGVSAIAADIFSTVDSYTPIVFAFVLGCSFLILMLVFRSIVIPVKAVIMNLLSVGTAYGLMVLVFQKGVAADLLGFQQAEVIDAWIPLFLFSILFGLSMDYHVFLLSRIRERYDETGDNAEAVAYGLQSTGGMITGAALIMVAVFGAFASGKTIINQQVGFGLAVAIFLDATLVRSVLVPATMEVLGRGNWYLPSWLRWLPDLRVEAENSPR